MQIIKHVRRHAVRVYGSVGDEGVGDPRCLAAIEGPRDNQYAGMRKALLSKAFRQILKIAVILGNGATVEPGSESKHRFVIKAAIAKFHHMDNVQAQAAADLGDDR